MKRCDFCLQKSLPVPINQAENFTTRPLRSNHLWIVLLNCYRRCASANTVDGSLAKMQWSKNITTGIYLAAMAKQQIYLEIKQVLVEQFAIDESRIRPNALLYDELDIDSIDAIDLLVRVKELTGKRIPPEDFQEVRAIEDVLNKLADL